MFYIHISNKCLELCAFSFSFSFEETENSITVFTTGRISHQYLLLIPSLFFLFCRFAVTVLIFIFSWGLYCSFIFFFVVVFGK